MFDTDGNGVIDFNEFAALWQYVCDWQETFRSFDLDNSGTIDRNELKSGIQSNSAVLILETDYSFAWTKPLAPLLIRLRINTEKRQINCPDSYNYLNT